MTKTQPARNPEMSPMPADVWADGFGARFGLGAQNMPPLTGLRFFMVFGYKYVAPTALEIRHRLASRLFHSPVRGDIFVESPGEKFQAPLGAAYSVTVDQNHGCAFWRLNVGISLEFGAWILDF